MRARCFTGTTTGDHVCSLLFAVAWEEYDNSPKLPRCRNVKLNLLSRSQGRKTYWEKMLTKSKLLKLMEVLVWINPISAVTCCIVLTPGPICIASIFCFLYLLPTFHVCLYTISLVIYNQSRSSH